MGKIYVLMGKSSSGKDSIYQELFQIEDLQVKKVIPYTTRPIRDGETNGVEYYFCTDSEVTKLEEEGNVIELRSYNTVYGEWKYFTANDGQIDLKNNSYLLVGVLQTYLNIRDYFGPEKVVPLYVEVEDGERLIRAIGRERTQKVPKYEEMCRRFLADSEDFSEEKLAAAGIEKRFENIDKAQVIAEIADYIRACK